MARRIAQGMGNDNGRSIVQMRMVAETEFLNRILKCQPTRRVSEPPMKGCLRGLEDICICHAACQGKFEKVDPTTPGFDLFDEASKRVNVDRIVASIFISL